MSSLKSFVDELQVPRALTLPVHPQKDLLPSEEGPERPYEGTSHISRFAGRSVSAITMLWSLSHE